MVSSDSGKDNDQDFELNLASIIDCFTVLITYLLVSASFISLGIFDVTVPSNVSTPEAPAPELSLTVALSQGGQLKVLLEGNENSKVILPAKGELWDFESLQVQLKSTHEKFPSLKGGMVTAEDSIAYKDVVKAIETMKTVFPEVAISAEPPNP